MSGNDETREYVVLILGDADRWWTTMTEQERAAGYAQYERFDAELAARGHEVTGGAELHSSDQARRIAAGGGPAVAGPFAEITEQIGGFYQVRTADLEDLLDCCQILAALGDTIQVQPVVTSQERG